MRASVVAEHAGVPAVSIVSTGFLEQAKMIGKGQGLLSPAIAEYPGVIFTDSEEDLRRKVEDVLVNNIIEAFAQPVEKVVETNEPEQSDIIFEGTLDEVQNYFYEKLWTDGLPIIPPTPERVEKFLKFTERYPDEVIGVLLPENREATVWNVAVNGVMAGCRPEYMPVLLAIIEAIADPDFRIEDAGSTPGWEPLIILNGPIIKELDFNYETGVLRVGRQANTSVGRFLRLYMRNVAGLRIPPGQTDKGTIAATFNVVLAENEDAVTELGWLPFSVDKGYRYGDNVVTVQSVMNTSPPTYSRGAKPLDHLETIGELIGKMTIAHRTIAGVHTGRFYPLLVMSPSIAGVIANGGWTKDAIRQYLHENVKVPAELLEKIHRTEKPEDCDLCTLVEQGVAPKEYCESTDPNRLVPVFLRPDWIGIVVSGDPGRNQSKGYVQNHKQGPPISKKIELPANWTQLLDEVKTI
ncbi:hypothetical protein ACFLXL_02735 [Chloroflexota bacterium]